MTVTAAAPVLAPRRARPLLLAAVGVCAACGLVYELVLLTLAVTLAGGGIEVTSLIVAGFVASLGVGALLAKPLLPWAATSFVAIEIVLGVIGGLSATALYVAFSFQGVSGFVLVAATVVIGVLVGAELPLLMTLLIGDGESAGRLIANLNAADYAGALIGGLAWPFLLLPLAGQVRGAALTGLVNLVAAAFVAAFVLRGRMGVRARAVSAAALLLAATLLGVLLLEARDVVVTARQRIYTDPVVADVQSPYQQIVLTERDGDLRLFLDGDLQFSSRDEHRYTEALVHPALAGDPARVLVIGGGDGLAARELLRHPSVRGVVQVELDAAVLQLARTRLGELNAHALDDARVRIVTEDGFGWLRTQPAGRFDAVVVDLPDPDTPVLSRLYSTEFYGLAARALAPGGRMVVQSGSPYTTPRAFWRIVSTVRSAGLGVTPYHVHVPSFGDWGYVLARAGDPPPLQLSPRAPPMRFVDPAVLATATVFPRDRPPLDLPPSTLDRPVIVDDVRAGYQR